MNLCTRANLQLKITLIKRHLNLTFLSYEDHIPPLERPISKTGFIVTTSANYDNFVHQGWQAFANTNQEWATKGEGVSAWIQISWPTAVTIWKLRLTGRKQSDEQFATWELSGGTVYNDALRYCTIRHYPDPAGYYFKSGRRRVTPQCRASKTVTIDKVQHCISRQSRRQSTVRRYK